MPKPRLLFCALVLAGCAADKQATNKPDQPSNTPQKSSAGKATDPWVLASADPARDTPALLWNGLIGVRVSRSANGLAPGGKPLEFHMIDEYEPAGEEKILDLPNPILVSWTVGNSIFDGDKKKEHDFIKSGGTPLDTTGSISDYKQSLDMHTGILHTEWTQKTDSAGAVKFACDTAVDPTQRVLGQKWTISVEKPSTFSVRSLDYSGPNDDQEFIGGDSEQTVAISASKTRAVTLSTKLGGADAGANSVVSGFRVQEGSAKPGTPVTFERVLSFGPHSAKPLAEFTEKNLEALKKVAPRPVTFDELTADCQKVWADRWKTDIVIDGPAEDQQAVRSFLFYLRSAIAPKIGRSVSPFGLSDSMYNGHVFWDADIWTLPALDLIDPAEAKSIADYRVAMVPAASSNFRQWFKIQQAKQAPGMNQPPLGVKFPWESSVTGAETVPGQSKLEDHITGSVVWSLTQAAALGLEPVSKVDQIASFAANYYYVRGTRGPGSPQMSIDNVMSPDENHVGDNDLYTNLLANWIVQGRRWNDVLPEHLPFKLPHDQKGLLSYDKDPVRSYKQAAAVLSIYPLQYPPAEADAKNMLQRFEPSVIKNGPAMSDSLHALIWARTGDVGKAYEDWQKSWQPFTQNDFLLFSEKRTKHQTYFVTGAAGALQTLMYGFLGFRVDSKPQSGSVWQKAIMGHLGLSLKPNLPTQWKSLTLKNFHVLDSRYTVTVDHSGAHVTQGD